jgi:hypothetical protein
MPWYIYLFQVVAGALIVNGVPHFTQGVSGAAFPTPFARPPGVGLSAPLVNTLWGFVNLAAGFALLRAIYPKGADTNFEWALVWLGGLLMAVALAWHFGRVRGAAR